MWNAGCESRVKDILASATYAHFNQEMRNKSDIERRDVRCKTASHAYSVTEEINLLHVQECLETPMS